MNAHASPIEAKPAYQLRWHRLNQIEWKKVHLLVDETFRFLRQQAADQHLSDSTRVLKGPWHFYITLEEFNGLIIFFVPRAPFDRQRIYFADLRPLGEVVNIVDTIATMRAKVDSEHINWIKFDLWEFLNSSPKSLIQHANIKALEFLSAHIGRHHTFAIETAELSPFPPKSSRVDPTLVFALMPFLRPWSNRLWNENLKKIIEDCHLNPRRADELTGANAVHDMWRYISAARTVVADLTENNPNVYYEVGLAHALGKDTILLAQDVKNIPFDVHQYRVIPYEDNPPGYARLRQRLTLFLLDRRGK